MEGREARPGEGEGACDDGATATRNFPNFPPLTRADTHTEIHKSFTPLSIMRNKMIHQEKRNDGDARGAGPPLASFLIVATPRAVFSMTTDGVV
jgi:hypothetical protein